MYMCFTKGVFMLRSLSLVVLALWAGSVSAAPRVTSYQASCDGCGEQRVQMGSHSFCALSHVRSGGSNSSCTVMNSQKSWYLIAMDSDRDETQACAAICMDLGDSAWESGAVVTPPPSPPLNGNTLTGRWTQSNGEGRLVFRFNGDYSGFTGVWNYGNATPDRQWNGRR